MAKRGRPTTADTCRRELIVSAGKQKKTYVCQRRLGHVKEHRQGAIRWPQARGR